MLLLSMAASLHLGRYPDVAVGRTDAAYRVDLNTADAAELSQLPEIGPVMAVRIVESREALGPYPDVESLLRVPRVSVRVVRRVTPLVVQEPRRSLSR